MNENDCLTLRIPVNMPGGIIYFWLVLNPQQISIDEKEIPKLIIQLQKEVQNQNNQIQNLNNQIQQIQQNQKAEYESKISTYDSKFSNQKAEYDSKFSNLNIQIITLSSLLEKERNESEKRINELAYKFINLLTTPSIENSIFKINESSPNSSTVDIQVIIKDIFGKLKSKGGDKVIAKLKPLLSSSSNPTTSSNNNSNIELKDNNDGSYSTKINKIDCQQEIEIFINNQKLIINNNQNIINSNAINWQLFTGTNKKIINPNGNWDAYPFIDFDPINGNAVITNRSGDKVSIFDSNGNFIKNFGSSGSGNGQLSTPCGICVDSISRNILVAEYGNSIFFFFPSK